MLWFRVSLCSLVGLGCLGSALAGPVLESHVPGRALSPANGRECRANFLSDRSKSQDVTAEQPAVTMPEARRGSCSITAEALLSRKATPTFVDVRISQEFDKYRIPGALNMPLYAVRTKAFLRNANVVLVNEGRSTAELERECLALRHQGLERVWVLDGGLVGWRRSGGSVVGDELSMLAANRMQPSEWVSERQYPDWVVVDISGDSEKSVRTLFPGAVRVASTNPGRLAVDLRAISNRKRRDGGAKILLVDRSGGNYDKYAVLFRDRKGPAVFFLDGGYEGYKAFLRNQVAMWQHLDHPPKKKGCS
jgi:rhodanese-related sulfurtransferase